MYRFTSIFKRLERYYFTDMSINMRTLIAGLRLVALLAALIGIIGSGVMTAHRYSLCADYVLWHQEPCLVRHMGEPTYKVATMVETGGWTAIFILLICKIAQEALD
jgi:hypothetical protein